VLTVLHPEVGADVEASVDLNEQSVVLRLEHERFSMLLTGDIGYETEKSLLAGTGNLRSTVLKVGHHGSSGSTGSNFLEEVSPTVAVIPVGADNKFGHPAPEVLSRLEAVVGEERVYMTTEAGTIELVTDGKKLWLNK